MGKLKDRLASRAQARAELKNIPYEIFIGGLSVLSIVNLVLSYVLVADSAIETILSVVNGLFSIVFLGDFVFRLISAPSSARYFFREWGWADLLASLPFPQVKLLRLFRIIRVVRLFRDVGARSIWNTLAHDRANSALMTLLFLGVLVLQFGSMTMLAIEGHAKDANITTASDALWYVIVTISTVGYGDQYPVTDVGRFVGAGIIIIGVGIFGTFTGYLANLFLSPRRAPDDDGAEELAPHEQRVQELLARHEETMAELRTLLEEEPPAKGPTAAPA